MRRGDECEMSNPPGGGPMSTRFTNILAGAVLALIVGLAVMVALLG